LADCSSLGSCVPSITSSTWLHSAHGGYQAQSRVTDFCYGQYICTRFWHVRPRSASRTARSPLDLDDRRCLCSSVAKAARAARDCVIGAWCVPGASAVIARSPAHGAVAESPNPSYLRRGQGMMMPRWILVLLWAAQRPRDERRPSGLKIAWRLIFPPFFSLRLSEALSGSPTGLAFLGSPVGLSGTSPVWSYELRQPPPSLP
jgi:hypothetical protein